MFTGIITHLGAVRAAIDTNGARMEIAAPFDTADLDIGASVACSGACMTVIEKGPGWFAVSVSAESLSKTTLGQWPPGTRINLERALRIGDELGGHIVSGHVDGVALIAGIRGEEESTRMTLEAPAALRRFIAPKGSVAIDGVSLTVNEVKDPTFGVNVIAHTLKATTLGDRQAGDSVNLEIDMLARYAARLQEFHA